jgi:hypothetical protein
MQRGRSHFHLTDSAFQLLKQASWSEIGQGSSNIAVATNSSLAITIGDTQVHTGRLVLKIPYSEQELSPDESAMDDPSRAARVYAELNPSKMCKIFETGWVSPFIDDERVSDEQTAEALINIYRNHRRIVLDAYIEGNLRPDDDGQFIVADPGQAIRQDSIPSQQFLQMGKHELPLAAATNYMPRTVAVIQALLYTEQHLSIDKIKDEHISEHTLSIVNLAKSGNHPITYALLDSLTALDEADSLSLIPDIAKNHGFDIAAQFVIYYHQLTQTLNHLGDAQQEKHKALEAHRDALKSNPGLELDVTSELKQTLNVDRNRSARIAAAVITNGLLMLLCLTVVGIAVAAPLFAEHKRRTGKEFGLFFTETKTLTDLRLAQMKTQRLIAGA